MSESKVYEIPAKQVPYHGIVFRSKLEAQWAVVWDSLGIKWIYEPERFIGLDDIDYDPDFYFPELDLYAEVKGTTKQLFASEKRISAAIDWQATPIGKSKGLLLLGPIPYRDVGVTGFAVHGLYLFWYKGICLGDFYLYSSLEYYHSPIHQIYLENGAWDIGDYYAGPQLPEHSSVDLDLVNFPASTCSKLEVALSNARRARFDFDDNLKKMLAENRTIIGGNK